MSEIVDVTQLAKVELHLHLDCCLSLAVVQQLRPSVTALEYEQTYIAPAKCTNLADFLRCVPQSLALLQTEEGLRLVVADLFQQLQRDRVLYAEIRFAPLLHTEAGLSPTEVVAIVETAAAAASAATQIEARLILCTLRHFSQAQSLQTVRLMTQFKGSLVAAFDLAGDEAGFPIDAHRAAFHYAIDHDIPRTAHAGEASGPQSVWETLHHFRPSRLGHGVRSIEDAALLAHLRQEQIHLEVCPTCNVQIGVFETYAAHPIGRLYDAGLSVGVSTDGRTTTNITLNEEYRKLQQQFGWQKEHFWQCNLNALRAAFVPEATKNRLIERLWAQYY